MPFSCSLFNEAVGNCDYTSCDSGTRKGHDPTEGIIAAST